MLVSRDLEYWGLSPAETAQERSATLPAVRMATRFSL